MDSELDYDGQPASEAFNWDRRLDRGMDELIGIARGVLADGNFVIEEASFLLNWLERNEPVRRNFFGKVLYDALSEALADDEMSAEEEDILAGLLLRFVGPMPETSCDASYSTDLPLDQPPPDVHFMERSFCFTGKFIFGTRRHCQKAVTDAGGSIHQYPIFATDYLVIGDLGSRDWIHSIGGRKIERAIDIRSQGHPLKLIAEQHWVGFFGRNDGLSNPMRPSLCGSAVEISVSRTSAVESSRPNEPVRPCLPLAGKTIVVTGTLKKYSRGEIETLIQKYGGRASGSVSKKTSYLLAGEEAGSKLEKANSLGVPIITEEQFDRLIAES
jgi:NAD-dependent DNA ligase